MAVTSDIRGNLTIYNHIKKRWEFEDGVPTDDNRPCIRCNKPPTEEGYDACLGYLPGVFSACCGHGISEPILITEEEAYR